MCAWMTYFLEASTASTAFCREVVWLLYQESCAHVAFAVANQQA